jgi:DNA ligase-associated metallophosphoesterase
MHNISIDCAGEQLDLFGAKAIGWSRARTLLVADCHLGKASAFRHAGIAVPEQVTAADLQLLSDLVRKTAAQRLVVLGDLFHAPTGQSEATLGAFERWRSEHSQLAIDLVLGNHDRAIHAWPACWSMTIAKQVFDAPFVFAHEQTHIPGYFALSGHQHPAVRCAGMRLACFHFSAKSGVLPAFGSFTGTHVIRPGRADQVFVVNGGEIAELPALLFRQAR